MKKSPKTPEEWQALLTPEQYDITRCHGTEKPFTGTYYTYHGDGTFACVCCGLPLFSGQHKYDSGSGWPSFWQPLHSDHLTEQTDTRYGMKRVEILCSGCDAHLGHIFEDGPPPTGLRYCINSAALQLQPSKG